MVSRRFLLAAIFASIFCSAASAQPRQQPGWRQLVEDRLAIYGHRNWIVIADSAYPLQSAPGIETVQSYEGQVETVRHVLLILSRSKHVRPVVYLDKELSFVPEQDAVGIGAYRQLLGGLFENHFPGLATNIAPHEDIIRRLDEASKTFHVLIIKSTMTLPYTSVFIQLNAAYWGDQEEQRLRQSIK